MATAATNFVFQTNPNALKKWRRTQCCYPNRFPQPPPVLLKQQQLSAATSLNQIKKLLLLRSPPKSAAAECEYLPSPSEKEKVLNQIKGWIPRAGVGVVLLLFFFMHRQPKQALAAASSSSVSVLGRVRATCSPFDSPPYSESQLRYKEAQEYSVARTYFYSYGWVLIPFAIYCVIWNVLSSDKSLDPCVLNWFKRQIKFLYLIVFLHLSWSNRQNPSTVLKLQVNLSNAGRALQTDLNRIAQTANTSTYEGVKSILTETAATFFRHPNCFISATSYVSVIKKNGRDGAQNCLDQLSLEERTKISLKPLSNVKYLQAASQISAYENQDEYLETNNHQLDASVESSTGQNSAIEIQDGCIKVIILVAVVGEHDFPTINSWDELKQVLQMLTSVDPEEPVYAYGVEVLWSPRSSSSWGWRRWFK